MQDEFDREIIRDTYLKDIGDLYDDVFGQYFANESISSDCYKNMTKEKFMIWIIENNPKISEVFAPPSVEKN